MRAAWAACPLCCTQVVFRRKEGIDANVSPALPSCVLSFYRYGYMQCIDSQLFLSLNEASSLWHAGRTHC